MDARYGEFSNVKRGEKEEEWRQLRILTQPPIQNRDIVNTACRPGYLPLRHW